MVVGSGGEGQSLWTAWEGPLCCICRVPAGSKECRSQNTGEFNEGLYKAQAPASEPRAVTLPRRGLGMGLPGSAGDPCSALGDKQPAGSLLRAMHWVCTPTSVALTCPQ